MTDDVPASSHGLSPALRALTELEKAVNFDPAFPCIFCERPVQQLSMGGPMVCPSCDCGRDHDGERWRQPALMYANAKRRMAILNEPRGLSAAEEPNSSEGVKP